MAGERLQHFRVHTAEGVRRTGPEGESEVDEQALGFRWLRLSEHAQESELRRTRLMVLEAIEARDPDCLSTVDVSASDDAVGSWVERAEFELSRDGTQVVTWTRGGGVIALLTNQEAGEIARRIAGFPAERDSGANTRTGPAVTLAAIGWAVRGAIVVLGVAVWMLADSLPLAVRIAVVVAVVIVAGLATWPINDWAVARYRRASCQC
ncbi:hypothetical protein [Conexibacter arvalis]|uniref:Uncharacterized protein n=1 Tax=Conexibacter arvalis TaxID=912552 RepID=A0A840IHU5_9ACTN|nr:hypothetical protein [Conexibacter arvalis]MBB4663624.1 hypothetical protein [Conexibacter arvalis]